MKWWEDERFGLFIHWGLYSVPAGEWKGDTTHAEWIRTTAKSQQKNMNNSFPSLILKNLTPKNG